MSEEKKEKIAMVLASWFSAVLESLGAFVMFFATFLIQFSKALLITAVALVLISIAGGWTELLVSFQQTTPVIQW